MIPDQVQSMLFALLSLVAGFYATGAPSFISNESRLAPVSAAQETWIYEPGVNQARVKVGPETTSPSPAPELSPTEVLPLDPVTDDSVLDGVESEEPVLEPATESALIPVSRQEPQPLTNLGEVGADALEYLSEIGFGAEYGSSSPVLHRWQEDVRIKVHGDPTATDMATLRQVAQELDSLIPDLTLQITDEDPNVDIHFLPESNFTSVDPEYVPVNLGFFRVWWDGQEVINRGRVLITTEGISQTERSHLIREELTQTLGLFMDSWQHQDSIFYQGWTATVEYSPLDREIIRLLYSPQLEPGMGRSQLSSAFAAD